MFFPNDLHRWQVGMLGAIEREWQVKKNNQSLKKKMNSIGTYLALFLVLMI